MGNSRFFSMKIILISALILSLFVCHSLGDTKASSKKDAHIKEVFSGTYRSTAKTSFVRDDKGDLLDFKSYSSIHNFLDAMPTYESYIKKYPDILSSGSKVNPNDMPRTEEELKNVQIDRCWILFINHMDDGDFHIIIGSKPNPETAAFLDIEVSALPNKRSKDTNLMINLRKKLLKMFPDIPNSSYKKIDPPLEVKVQGSVFFDGAHKPGELGPADYNPQTVWEIHPVYDIEPL
jgi:hypothetical protein